MKIEIKSKTKLESGVDKKKDADLVKIKKGGRKKAQIEENAVDEKVGPVAEKRTGSKKDETKGKKKEKKEELDEKVKEKEVGEKKKKSVEGKDKEEKKEDKKMKNKEEEGKKAKKETGEKVKKSKKKENVVEEKEKPAPKQSIEAKKKTLRKNEEGKDQSMSISLNKRIRKSDGSSAGKDTAKGALEKKEEQKVVTKKKEKQVAGLLGKTEDQKMVVKKKKGSYRPEELVDQEMAEEKKRGDKVVGLLEKTEDQKMIVGPTGAAEEDSAKKDEQMLGRDEGSRRKKSPRSAKAKKTPAEQPAEVSAPPIGNIFEDVEPIKKDDKSDLLTTKALEKMPPHKELGIENLVFNVYAKLYCFFGEEYTEAIEGTMLVCSDPLRVIFVRKGIKQVMFDSVINYDTKAVLRNARVTFGIIYEDKKKRLDLYAARFFKEEDAKMFYDFISNKK
ncbi:hypothetical protein THOM_3278 [Trachipleistophora hominis]|uniref:Uncharacterized protein n=1 Tax=Trachipleistophora hominis TaxID=72359 RepID=L7JQU5_TRAHO|nr:hypothetical protein THOM_3278 [Trachipleistophora hominis]